MRRRTPFQRAYLTGSTLLGLAALGACLVAASREPPSAGGWALALVLAIIYGSLWLQNEQFETPTPDSRILIEVSNTPLLVALALAGPPAVPLLLAADFVARFALYGGHQRLGYLFNANQLATTAVVTLAAIDVVAGGEIAALHTFPSGTVQFALIFLIFEVFQRLNQTLLVAVGSRRPVGEILAGEARPLALVTLIPGAMGLLIATAVTAAPGLVLPLLIPVVLARYAIRAIARWAQRHILLREQVAEQTAAIRAQADELQALEQARHQHTVALVHDLEHEFRLGARLVQEALEPGTHRETPKDPRQHVLAIGDSFTRGLAMTADILLGSTLRAGTATLHLQPSNLTALAAAVTGRYLPVAAAAGVQLTLDCDEVLELPVDAPKLERALANLLANAIDYTKGCSQRRVTVALGSTAATIKLRVSDTGIGIEPAAIATIGQRFTRLAAGAERHHGYGLGLFGVAAIVAMHGGSLAVASPGRDQGTCVTLALPIRGAPPIDAPPPAAHGSDAQTTPGAT